MLLEETNGVVDFWMGTQFPSFAVQVRLLLFVEMSSRIVSQSDPFVLADLTPETRGRRGRCGLTSIQLLPRIRLS